MASRDRRLGLRPECGHTIRRGDVLITYRRSDDSIGTFAECPSCETVVDPRGR